MKEIRYKHDGVKNDPTLFIRAHVRIACKADEYRTERSVIYPNIRRNTTIGYLQDAWKRHGGWD